MQSWSLLLLLVWCCFLLLDGANLFTLLVGGVALLRPLPLGWCFQPLPILGGAAQPSPLGGAVSSLPPSSPVC